MGIEHAGSPTGETLSYSRPEMGMAGLICECLHIGKPRTQGGTATVGGNPRLFIKRQQAAFAARIWRNI